MSVVSIVLFIVFSGLDMEALCRTDVAVIAGKLRVLSSFRRRIA
jgi:hypothetical protein